MKVSDYISRFLLGHGVTHVFGYPGGAVTHLVDSLYQCPGIRFIGTCHEQAAAFAAEGYARMTNGLGAALATSGPGATNLLTGIGSAYFDSIPCLYLTGQVNTYEYKGDLSVRQLGFQETDIVSVVRPITKYAVRVTDALSIRYELEKAVFIATSGRKGPVLIDLPMDVQRTEIREQELCGYPAPPAPTYDDDLEPVIRLINESSRPVLLAGGGVRSSGAVSDLFELAQRVRIPVVTSLLGRDAFDNASELYLGMIGVYGNRYANFAIANSDLILSLGSRLDTRQTGTDLKSFAREAKLIRIDVDQNELDHRIKPDETAVLADAKEWMRALLARSGEIHPDTGPWLERVFEYKRRYPTFLEGLFPDTNFIIESLSGLLSPRDVVCADVGQNQMWVAQSLKLTGRQRLLTSGGMGSMGFALPCAIGAHYSGVPGKIIAIAGDGGMQMNIQDLQTVARERIPVKIIVLNNRCLGMIRQFQQMYFDSRFVATVQDYSAPDFCAIAAAYGIPAVCIENELEFETIGAALAADGPMLIEIRLPQDTHVTPKLAVNRPIEDQEPLLDRAEFLENMIIRPYEPK